MKSRVITKINQLLSQLSLDDLLETLHYMESIANSRQPSRPHRKA